MISPKRVRKMEKGDKKGVGAKRCFKPPQEGKSVAVLPSLWGQSIITNWNFYPVFSMV